VDGNYFGMGQNSVAMNINEKGCRPSHMIYYFTEKLMVLLKKLI